jgi:hypothetical protein
LRVPELVKPSLLGRPNPTEDWAASSAASSSAKSIEKSKTIWMGFRVLVGIVVAINVHFHLPTVPHNTAPPMLKRHLHVVAGARFGINPRQELPVFSMDCVGAQSR